MSNYLRKAKKRKLKEQDRGMIDFMKIVTHYFKNLPIWIEEMTDPRHASYTTYTQSDLIHLGILKNICSVESMCQMEEKFNEEACLKNLKWLSKNEHLDEIPHADTLNYYFEKLSPNCLDQLREKMIRSLIRTKAFYHNKLLDKYWIVILDGTGLTHFQERHCSNCLVTKTKGLEGKERLDYYHKVVEAKIVLSDHLILSLGTEFIENEDENVSKQDCEINASKRLLKRIKKQYPRLDICLLGDALYATEPMKKLCRENHWEYIFNLKEGNNKLLKMDYEWLSQGGAKKEQERIGVEKGIGGYINHVGELTGKKEVANIYEYCYKKKGKGKEKEITFCWVTSIEIKERGLEKMIEAARKRWKIENEGFNNQKNGLYRIEHCNSRNSNAMKNHYLLTQISDILMQVYLAWHPLLKIIKQSKKNTSSRLLESFRQHPITNEDVYYINKNTKVYLK